MLEPEDFLREEQDLDEEARREQADWWKMVDARNEESEPLVGSFKVTPSLRVWE